VIVLPLARLSLMISGFRHFLFVFLYLLKDDRQ
jgi:hypothetical protein